MATLKHSGNALRYIGTQSTTLMTLVGLYLLIMPTLAPDQSVFSSLGIIGTLELIGLSIAIMLLTIIYRSPPLSRYGPSMPSIDAGAAAFLSPSGQPELNNADDNDLDADQRFSLVLRTFDIATFYCDLQHRYIWSHNFLGSPNDLLGKTAAEILPKAVADKLLRLKDKALNDGGMHDVELTFDIGTETRTYVVQVAPRRDLMGNIIGTMAVSCDVTERTLWQKHLVMMMREVNHRARNLLAIITSVCEQTSRTALNVSEYREKITGRVMSLASSMDLVNEDNWVSTSLEKLVTVQLSCLPHDKMKRVHVHGAKILVKSKAVQSIGLAIHELAMNASKHGALSCPNGRIDVRVTTDEIAGQPQLVFRWQETSTLKILPSDLNGFGMRLLNRIVSAELNGSSDFTWHLDGIEYILRMPSEVIGIDLDLENRSAGENDRSTLEMRESLTGQTIMIRDA